VKRLTSPNGYQRDIAQRILTERLLSSDDGGNRLKQLLDGAFVFTADNPETSTTTIRALGILMSQNELYDTTHLALLQSPSPLIRSWAVRAAGEQSTISEAVRARVFELRNDSSSQVRLQVAIAAAKQDSIATIPALVAVLDQAGEDPLVPRIVWQNLHPLLEKQTAEFVAEVEKLNAADSESLSKPVIELLPRAADRILSTGKPDTLAVAQLVKLLLSSEATDESADRCLQLLTARIRSGEIAGESLTNIQAQLADPLNKAMNQKLSRPSTLSAVELAASLRMQDGINRASQLNSMTDDESIRLRLINALITANDDSGLDNTG
jgi:hypothetical protein